MLYKRGYEYHKAWLYKDAQWILAPCNPLVPEFIYKGTTRNYLFKNWDGTIKCMSSDTGKFQIAHAGDWIVKNGSFFEVHSETSFQLNFKADYNE